MYDQYCAELATLEQQLKKQRRDAAARALLSGSPLKAVVSGGGWGRCLRCTKLRLRYARSAARICCFQVSFKH